MPVIYYDKYEANIGLEVHAQLNTKTKIFCSCRTDFGADANTQVCPVCLGLPGVLPVLNELVLEKAIMAGLALGSQISELTKFDRKQYFYPDLPKAYQISQYEHPVCLCGAININDHQGQPKVISITRIHMEEDAGKLIHSQAGGHSQSFVDLNRTGVPLIEIVSEPEINSPDEAYQYLASLKAILQYTDISDGNMEQGSLRCDANVSVRKLGEQNLGTRCEIKNLNSFKGVRSSIKYEIERQIDLLESGQIVVQQTRLWNADEGKTRPMRDKDEAHDYRYFPDPDLVPIVISRDYVAKLQLKLPELPANRINRLQRDYELSLYDAEVLCLEKALVDYYEQTVQSGADAKKSANWIMAEMMYFLNEKGYHVANFPVSPNELAKLLIMVGRNIINGKIAKSVYSKMVETGQAADVIVRQEGLEQVSDDSAINRLVIQVLDLYSEQVAEYRQGKDKVFGFLVGQIMKLSKGKANPKLVNDVLKEKLDGL